MTTADQKSFQIRLVGRNLPKLKSIQNKSANHVITIAPLMTMSELEFLTRELFGVPMPKSKDSSSKSSSLSLSSSISNSSAYQVEFWIGFPPKKIDIEGGGGSTLVSGNGVRGGDSVTVKVEKKQKPKKKKTAAPKSPQKPTAPKSRKRPLPSTATAISADGAKSRTIENDGSVSSTSTVPASDPAPAPAVERPKRASAKAASESFKEVIKAQDKLVRDEKRKRSKKSNATTTTTSNTSNSSHSSVSAAQLHARKKAAEARAISANSQKMASLPGGRRLNDPAPSPQSPQQLPIRVGRTTSSTSTTKKNRDKSIFSGINSETDISFALMSSIDTSSGSKTNGKVSKVLRGAMRLTVEKSYEASRAVVRYSAIKSGKIEFIPSVVERGANANNEAGSFTVKYPKGVEGRGFYEDQEVHIITLEMLKAVLRAVHADHDEESNGLDQTSSGREMLKPINMALLSPRVYWSLWFHFHNSVSSIEDALEALLPDLNWKFLHCRSRQLSEKAKDNLSQKKGADVKAEAIIDHKAGVKAVQAVEEAMANMYDETVRTARERAADAALARYDQKERIEWDVATPIDVDEDEIFECINECSKNFSPEVVQKCVQVLITKCKIYNWRVLANATPDDMLMKYLEEAGIAVSKDVIEMWIQAAQIRTIEEIMLEILDGNQDLFFILNEEASCGTPKDLSLFQFAPGILLEEVPSLNHGDLTTTASDMKGYCSRAAKALETLLWLNSYATGIQNEDHEE